MSRPFWKLSKGALSGTAHGAHETNCIDFRC